MVHFWDPLGLHVLQTEGETRRNGETDEKDILKQKSGCQWRPAWYSPIVLTVSGYEIGLRRSYSSCPAVSQIPRLISFSSTWSNGDMERQRPKPSAATYCNIVGTIAEATRHIFMREGTCRESYQETGLPHTSVPHHHTLKTTIIIISAVMFSLLTLTARILFFSRQNGILRFTSFPQTIKLLRSVSYQEFPCGLS